MPIVKSKPIKELPNVSAIIAAYNEENHLANCIESLLNQTYKNIEVIIVENGNSSDKTFKIAKDYEKKYKNVRAFSIPGKQKGPGNAWNYGVIKSKGEIIMICGADLEYGKNYIRKGIKPILSGESVGIVHNLESCKNIQNLWARAFFKNRSSLYNNRFSRVFSLIRKDYLIKRPFNSKRGYADDQTIFIEEGAEFLGIDLEVSHTNPDSLSDTWSHSRWVGRSINDTYTILLILPFFPIYAIYKSIIHLKKDFYLPFIFFLPIYYSIKYFAYFIESIKKVLERFD